MSLWRNEVLSPVILPYNKDLVDYVRVKLRAQQDNIDRYGIRNLRGRVRVD